ncbi:MAG: transcriptional regulator with XRE-family HTH domain [Pseudohongiellaceae bacterium]|jgi:transcriptional regulator with XRE-family HTH domain
MSDAQLADRLGVTKGRVSQAESAELSGSATLKSMQKWHKLWTAVLCMQSFQKID